MTQTQEVWTPQTYRPSPETSKIKMLVYGRPGAGKTTLVASASVVEEMSPILYISAESGVMSITEDWEGRIDTSRVEAVDFEGYAHLQKLFNYLAFEKHPYRTVILDSLTELMVYVVNKWKDHLVPKNEQGFAMDDERDKKLTLKIYEKATDQLRGICRKFRDLPMHVLMVAHDDTSEQNGATVTHPALTPKFRDSVIGYMDLVGYMTTRTVKGETPQDEPEVVRLLSFVPRPNRIAKDRSPRGKMGGVMEDPTMQGIWDKLNYKPTKDQNNGK